MRSTLYFAAVLAHSALAVSAEAACPPEGFTSKKDLNPSTYFSGVWYTLKQVRVAFQPVTNLYCVSGSLKLVEQDGKPELRILNGGSIGGVTGTRSTAQLNGTIPDLAVPSQALVGPRQGAYWVIEAGTYASLLSGKSCDSDNYEWAIVSGGAPVAQSTNGCLPGVGPTNAKGFWLLSRKPVVPQEVTDKITAVAAAKGYDVSALVTIPQEGCTYDA
jgi:lipocalin